MNAPVIVDATELQDDAIAKFVDAFASGQYPLALKFLELVFYLAEHRVGAAR
jgi:hypothetical protein